MARIEYSELIDVIEQSPDYCARWKLDVPASQALYVGFGPTEGARIESEVFVAVDGSEIVLKRLLDGRIAGIEIM